ILSGERSGTPAVARNQSPFTLNLRFVGTSQISHRLPANCRITLEKPSDDGISFYCHRAAQADYRKETKPGGLLLLWFVLGVALVLSVVAMPAQHSNERKKQYSQQNPPSAQKDFEHATVRMFPPI